MGWFRNLLGFSSRDVVGFVLKLSERILKAVIGNAARDLQRIAWEEVKKAEESGLTGASKYEMAFKALKKRFPEIKENAINLAIESAVAALSTADNL